MSFYDHLAVIKTMSDRKDSVNQAAVSLCLHWDLGLDRM